MSTSQRYSESVQIYFQFYIGFHCILSVASLIILQLRRTKEPVKSRSPLVLSTLVPLNCFVVVEHCLLVIYHKDYPCKRAVFDYFLFCATVLMYSVTRFVFTYLKFRVARESLTYAMEKYKNRLGSPKLALEPGNAISSIELSRNTSAQSRPFFSRYRKFLHDKRVTMIAWTMFLVLMIPSIFVISFPAGYDTSYPCYNDDPRANAFLWTYRVLALLIAIVTAFAFRKEPLDSFWMKEEVRAVLISAFITLIIFEVMLLEFPDFDQTTFPVLYCAICLFFSVVLVLCAIYPGYLSFKEEKQMKKSFDVNIDLKNLQDLVKLEDGENAFIQFLVLEFSVENWLFRKAVISYKEFAASELQRTDIPKQESRRIVREEVGIICCEYILVNALRAVNLPHEMRVDIEQKVLRFESLTEVEICELFDQAEQEIMRLLSQDSFRRFLRSQTYKKFIEDINKSKLQAKALEVAGL